MKIYISGPITYGTDVKERFAAVRRKLTEQGYQVLSPLDIPACEDFSCTLLKHEVQKGFAHSWACFLKYDLIVMMKECEGILMMDGWQDSHGARLELTVASAVGMHVVFERELGF